MLYAIQTNQFALLPTNIIRNWSNSALIDTLYHPKWTNVTNDLLLLSDYRFVANFFLWLHSFFSKGLEEHRKVRSNSLAMSCQVTFSESSFIKDVTSIFTKFSLAQDHRSKEASEKWRVKYPAVHWLWSARGVTVIVVRSELGYPSSSLEQGSVHFIQSDNYGKSMNPNILSWVREKRRID